MILLDTHIWIWFLSNPEKLSSQARKAVEDNMEKGSLLISSISVWEIAVLNAKNRLHFSIPLKDWVSQSEKLPFLQFIPVNNTIALNSVLLPASIHNDPADRIVIATALSEGVPLVTKDEKIIKNAPIETIW